MKFETTSSMNEEEKIKIDKKKGKKKKRVDRIALQVSILSIEDCFTRSCFLMS